MISVIAVIILHLKAKKWTKHTCQQAKLQKNLKRLNEPAFLTTNNG